MTRILAISWTSQSLRFVHAESTKSGALRVLEADERSLLSENVEAESIDRRSPVDAIKELIGELKASRATLIIAPGRGAFDASIFSVPPATDSELPTIVRNVALRRMTGLSEESRIDYFNLPKDMDGQANVCAMALLSEYQQDIRNVLAHAKGTSRIVVGPHALQIFAAASSAAADQATLVVAREHGAAHLLLIQHGLPLLSRTIRLPPDLTNAEAADDIAAETRRSLLAVGNLSESDIGSIVVVGTPTETEALADRLNGSFSLEPTCSSPGTLVESGLTDERAANFTTLLAAAAMEANGEKPIVDFANPRQSPSPVNPRATMLAAAAVLACVVAGGWYYVHSMFSDIDAENAALRKQLNELSEVAKQTLPKRRMAAALAAWEKSRISWLDEMRDITLRMPPSPDLTISQLSIAPSSGRSALMTFRGTATSTDVIRKMEERLNDETHRLRTPAIREQMSGDNTVWSFQTTMTLSARPPEQYVSHLSADSTVDTVERAPAQNIKATLTSAGSETSVFDAEESLP